jgi:myo-inositol-1(or 4)-monophosphatase
LPVAELQADTAALAAELEAAVREAGAFALQRFRSPLKSWTKLGNSPVSEVDIAVDDMLRARLRAAAPDCAWLSEESVDDPARLNARHVWVVDPIDGTRAFLAHRDDWAVSAALVDNGRPVAAALFRPVDDTMFLAVAGQGATINGGPAAPRPGSHFDGARVAGPKRPLEALTSLCPGIEPLPKVHSLALRLAMVAAGTIDIAFAGPNSHDWDIAAADLIVHEAGGDLTTLDGRVPTYNRPNPVHGALAAAGHDRHAALLRLIAERPKTFT